MKKVGSTVLKMLVAVIASVCIGGLLMVLLYSLPTDTIVRHVDESKEVFGSNKIHEWAGPRYSRVSNSTDAIMVATAICRDSDSTIENALLNPAYVYEGASKTENIIEYFDGNTNYKVSTYGRYWHGYLLYMIPGLMIFDIYGLKMAMMIAQFLLVIWLMIELSKRNIIYSFIYAIAILFINPITTVLTFQEADIYLISLIFTIFILKKNDWLLEKNRYCYLFLFNGITVAFIDFLTYPLVAWGLPMATFILINYRNNKESFIKILTCSLSWCLGYVGMWAGKWILASLFTNTNVIQDAIVSVTQRTSSFDDNSKKITYLMVINEIFDTVKDTPNLVLYLLGIAGTIGISIKQGKKLNLNNFKKIGLFLLIGISPFVWYFVAKNHAYIHPWIEYRHLAITFYCLLISIQPIYNRVVK